MIGRSTVAAASATESAHCARRHFLGGVAAMTAAGFCERLMADGLEDTLDLWQRETDLVTPETFAAYFADGDTRGLRTLEKLESAFEKILREIRETKVGDRPAVWSVYNMGYVVKTREALFSIDLVHRRALELEPFLDFALVTHNHDDHYRPEFVRALNRSGKTVISNFLDNYAALRTKGGVGGYTRAEKTFKLKDVEIRTSLVDHNGYLIDFTTAFEIRIGDFLLYHSGDCGIATKLRTTWGRPDLWLFFPGCGVDVADAVKRIGAKRTCFGHLWELGHQTGEWKGRLSKPIIVRALEKARTVGVQPEVPLWGARIPG